MGSEPNNSKRDSISVEQTGQTIKGHQVNIGGDAQIEHVGDRISGDVVISGQIDGDVQVTYVQRAPVPPPPPPLRPPQTDLFVGRDTELYLYAEGLDQAGIAVVSGMAGMGKTTLAAELARRVSRPEKVFWHSFHEGEGVEGIIWRLAAFLAANGEDAVWEMLQNAQMNNSRPPPPELLFDYLVEQIRGHNFLLCLDDFQYVADNALLNQLVERIRPMLPAGDLKMIITSREMPDFVQLVSFDPLAGLTPSDFGQMLAASDIYLPETQIAQLHSYTAGNAQMLTLALDLLGSGYEAQELLDRLVETDDLEDFLMDEVESRLSRNERLVMSAVAILQGYPGSRAAIEAVLDGRRQRRVIRDLSDRFLLTVTRGEGQRRYSQHAIVRDFFYEGLNQRERRRMHLRAAEFYGDAEPDILPAIRHYLLGGSPSEAAVLAEENVYTLLSQGQATALDNLLAQIERGQLSARRWMGVQLVSGQVSSFLGLGEQAKENYQDAMNELLSLPGSAETAELNARICLGMAELLETQDPQEALLWNERGLAVREDISQSTRAELTILRGTLQMQSGEFDQARLSFESGLALLPEPPSSLHSRVYKNLVSLYSYEGQFQTSTVYAQQALAISRQLHDRFEESSILNNFGIIQYLSGNWSDAIASFEEALTIAKEIGNRDYIVDFELNLGKALIYLGAFAESANHLENALQLAQETGNELSEMFIRTNLAELQVKERSWIIAEENLIAAETLALKLNARIELPTLYSTWTEFAVGKGKPEEAIEYGAKAFAIASELGDPLEVGVARRLRGLAAQAASQFRQAESELRTSIQDLQGLDPYQQACSQMALGLLLIAVPAREEEAIPILESAKATFSELGAVSDLAQVQQALVMHADGNKNTLS